MAFNDKQNTRETRLCFQESQWRESDQMSVVSIRWIHTLVWERAF